MPLLRSSDLQYRRGTLNFSLLSLVRTVTFDEPMPGPYDLFWAPGAGVSVGVTISNQTAAGFTMTVGINLSSMDLQWLAVERRT